MTPRDAERLPASDAVLEQLAQDAEYAQASLLDHNIHAVVVPTA